jgi:hypothetical protein
LKASIILTFFQAIAREIAVLTDQAFFVQLMTIIDRLHDDGFFSYGFAKILPVEEFKLKMILHFGLVMSD